MSNFDAITVKNNIVKWVQTFFEQNGKDCKAVVGISGGKDSSVVAALCVEALGADRVYGVLMPQGYQSDIDYSYKLVEHLGIEYCVVDINPVVKHLKHEIKPQLGEQWSRQTSINLPARIRMSTLYAVSQTINGRVANTCNLTETLLSWETRWGDAVGDFSPLGDLTVQEVKAVGYELGLPVELIEKIPIDGLCNQTDEEALGFKYSVADKYIRTGEIDDLEVKKNIDDRVRKYKFKREPIPVFCSHMKRFVA